MSRTSGCSCPGRRRWKPADAQAGRHLPTPTGPRDHTPPQVCGSHGAWSTHHRASSLTAPDDAGGPSRLWTGSQGSERCDPAQCHTAVKGSEPAVPMTRPPAQAAGLSGACPYPTPVIARCQAWELLALAAPCPRREPMSLMTVSATASRSLLHTPLLPAAPKPPAPLVSVVSAQSPKARCTGGVMCTHQPLTPKARSLSVPFPGAALTSQQGQNHPWKAQVCLLGTQESAPWSAPRPWGWRWDGDHVAMREPGGRCHGLCHPHELCG